MDHFRDIIFRVDNTGFLCTNSNLVHLHTYVHLFTKKIESCKGVMQWK